MCFSNNQIKTIKNLKKWIVGLCLLISTFIISCRYEEGPAISFRSVLSRIEGQYQLKKIFINDIDCIQEFLDSCHCNFIFLSYDYYIQGTLKLQDCRSIGQYSDINGYYKLEDNSKSIRIDIPSRDIMKDSIFGYGPFDFDITTSWNIIKLTNTEMIFETIYQGKNYRVEFEEFEY